MKKQKEILIIIPAYNEEKTIVPLLEQLEQPEIAQMADVLIMNDASLDATNYIAKKRHHEVVTHVFNLGYGSGLQLGYKYAIRKGYQYVIQMDADGQHDVCNIPKIYEALKTKDSDGNYPDIVLGSRFLEGSSSFPVSAGKKDRIHMVPHHHPPGNGSTYHGPDHQDCRVELENFSVLFHV